MVESTSRNNPAQPAREKFFCSSSQYMPCEQSSIEQADSVAAANQGENTLRLLGNFSSMDLNSDRKGPMPDPGPISGKTIKEFSELDAKKWAQVQTLIAHILVLLMVE